MAGAYSAPPCVIRPFTSRKPLLLACSVITPRPRKLTKRKNHLRPKILRTLTKPYTIPLTETVITPLETPIQHTHIFPSDDDELKAPENQQLRLPEIEGSAGLSDFTELNFPETPVQQDLLFPSDLETSENQELLLSEPAGAVHGSGTFGKSSLVKYGLWFVGAFVFQTFCAVWFLGSTDYSGKNGSSGYKNELLELDSNGKHKIRMFVNGDGKQSVENGGIVLVDEAEMEKKIGEIQHMAREARKKERLETKATKFDEEHEDEVEDNDVKIGIKKEVDERLIKLRKGLEKVRSKQPTNSVAHPKVDSKKNDTDDDDDDKLDEKELNAALIFKRKNKSRDFASKPSNKPKGFMARDHQSVMKNSLEKRGRKKLGDSEESEAGTDISANRNNGNSLLEAVELKESSIGETATIPNAGSTLVDVVDPKEASSMKSARTLDRRKNSYGNGISGRNVAKDPKVLKSNGGYTHAKR